MTSIFVTHDQEEAMEVAEQIAVINHGRIEQAGSPDELYDRPANAFVMGFVGPVAELGGRLMRPHDIAVFDQHEDGTDEALVERITRIGFEVRLDLVFGGGERVQAHLTKAEADRHELVEGEIVWVRPDGVREFTRVQVA